MYNEQSPEAILSEKTAKQVILARNAKLDTSYLIHGTFQACVIHAIHTIGDSCTSVTASVESYETQTSISGGTQLIPYSDEYHIYRKKSKPIKKANKRTRELKEKKIPRSVIIDSELLKVKKGDTPDWEMIAQKVIEGCQLLEKTKPAIINQTKARHKWYTVEGKVNPASKNES